MKQFIQVVRQPAALTLAVLLAACGGGGGGGAPVNGSPAPGPAPIPAPAPVPAPTPAPVCEITISADATVASGKTAGAAALSACTPYITSIAWAQVSGPSVTLQAARSPTVAIETSTAGVIRLRADATLSDGRTSSATTDITVAAPVSGSFVTVRADHSLRVGTDTSVRAWPTLASGEAVSKIVWSQVSGTPVKMNTDDQDVMIFTTPATASVDSTLVFRATMTTTSGKVDSDDVIVSIDRQAATPNGYIFKNTARVHPYVVGGAYANVLARCSYDVGLYSLDTGTTLCKAGTLPLLQSDAGSGGVPSVAQVMARVIVSHDFLGANFEKFLNSQDAKGDFRRMLAATSTIVIGSHVRPSFYQPATGAIYLDANYLWLTPEQRDVVTEVPDYRLAYDDQLNFTSLGRLVKNNDYARRSYPAGERVTRPESDLILGLGRLLYHELAHAGDYFAPSSRNLNTTLSIYGNVEPRAAAKSLPSDDLATAYPLLSSQMKGLGQVMFLGVTPTAVQKAYTAAEVGNFFSSDVASDEYAYSINDNANSREDLAMLFEEFMMSYRHGIQYDIAYSNLFKDGMTSDQLIVAWGQRGRIALPSIKPRIKLVIIKVAPWIDPAVVDTLPATIQMPANRSWEANLALSGPVNGAPQPASFFSMSEKRSQARFDVAERRHAH
ncbi:hypothetical protein [Massilia sp. TSP1-1-2]|uniref:hypothetical protein n=1 Tax=Massilia sp. TSP1-1-2 TaxID=2804649 RepID=UPI003CFB0555